MTLSTRRIVSKSPKVHRTWVEDKPGVTCRLRLGLSAGSLGQRISRNRVPRHGAFALSLAALTLFLSATLSDSAVGGETGAIPYRTISDIFDHFAGLEDKDKLVLTVRVVPAKKSVSTVPIDLLIKSRSGPITLRLGADGELTDFPLKAELEAENPPVASNQPKGTLSLQAVLGTKYSGKLTENLNWHLEEVRQAKAGAKAQAGLLSFGFLSSRPWSLI